MTGRIAGVLFDLGGTLVDIRDYVGWSRIARGLGWEVDSESLGHAFVEEMREVDRPRPTAELSEFWRGVLHRASGREVPEAVARGFLAEYERAPQPVHLFSDVRRCLDALKDQGRALGIISNSRSELHVRELLQGVGILSYFTVTLSSGTERILKPDAEIFQRGVHRLGVAPAQALYVGDLPYTDAWAAERAGLHGLWLNREGTGLGSGAPEVTSLLEVPLWIQQLENENASRRS